MPVGRRGIYQGVILNMHLHWKKHQTLKVVVKTFTPEEVKEIAVELARLSGGIVLDIQEGNTIIMYRGKNYSQPPTEIMSPRITLPRKKVIIHFPSFLFYTYKYSFAFTNLCMDYFDSMDGKMHFGPAYKKNLKYLSATHFLNGLSLIMSHLIT